MKSKEASGQTQGPELENNRNFRDKRIDTEKAVSKAWEEKTCLVHRKDSVGN